MVDYKSTNTTQQKEVFMNDSTDNTNSRIQELEFLISIMNDLAHTYQGHNERLLEELIANLTYRRDSEELTKTAKSKSEKYSKFTRNMVA